MTPCLLRVCAVKRRRFPVGANPTRRTLQPEATGAGMEVTKCLKPSGKRATNWWQRECAGRNASEHRAGLEKPSWMPTRHNNGEGRWRRRSERDVQAPRPPG